MSDTIQSAWQDLSDQSKALANAMLQTCASAAESVRNMQILCKKPNKYPKTDVKSFGISRRSKRRK